MRGYAPSARVWISRPCALARWYTAEEAAVPAVIAANVMY